ncbi:MAG TPA: endolytic transglycosylase MltG [Syntrophorhabdaceae bacterium]|nr:endolytic transglycosylase MltG [Syntrophorhabdaceae bacterium]
MLAARDKKTIVIAIIIFIFSQGLIFACIPRDNDRSIRPVVVKQGTGVAEIANALKKEGIIRSSALFMIGSLMYRGHLIAGEYELTRDMSTFEIIRKMGQGKRKIYVLKIIEGNNIYTIAESVGRSGIMTREEFLELSTDKKYLESMGIEADSMEGYLSSNTYYYSKEIDREKFLKKIALRTLKLFSNEDIRRKMASLGMNTHQTLTLASMIEKESGAKDEKPLVSAVFHNRILKGMSLDCDPTVIYGTKGFGSPIRKIDLATRTPYNTYMLKGYPRGPICTPSKDSIMAALNPAPVDYLYFVSKNDGTHVFSRDMAEHNRYVEMYQRNRTTQ